MESRYIVGFGLSVFLQKMRWNPQLYNYWEGWGGSLKKVLILVQRSKHKSTPDPVAAPKNIPFGTIFIEFGDNKKYWTFSGLELAPKKQRKANWRSQLHAQRSKMHSISLGPSEKIPFVQKHKEIAICAILRENPILRHSQRLRKLTGALSCMHKGPKCIQSLWDHPKKIAFVQKHKESAICAILREKHPIWSIPRG